MDTTEFRVSPEHIDKVLDWMRSTGSPQHIEDIAQYYIRILRRDMVGSEDSGSQE